MEGLNGPQQHLAGVLWLCWHIVWQMGDTCSASQPYCKCNWDSVTETQSKCCCGEQGGKQHCLTSSCHSLTVQCTINTSLPALSLQLPAQPLYHSTLAHNFSQWVMCGVNKVLVLHSIISMKQPAYKMLIKVKTTLISSIITMISFHHFPVFLSSMILCCRTCEWLCCVLVNGHFRKGKQTAIEKHTCLYWTRHKWYETITLLSTTFIFFFFFTCFHLLSLVPN